MRLRKEEREREGEREREREGVRVGEESDDGVNRLRDTHSSTCIHIILIPTYL